MTGKGPKYWPSAWLGKYWIDLALGLAAVAVPSISAWIGAHVGDAQWFSRSGSLMVLFSAVLEFRQTRFGEVYATHGDRPLQETPPPERAKIGLAALLLIVVGTVIWGYGDKLLPLLVSIP